MVREKYLQTVMDLIRSKGCATRRYIIDQLTQINPNLTSMQAERIVDELIESLLKRGVIVRKGRGMYCWNAP
jgi:aryl-phospho-beta-D-glucosidase BglC (GH1 family)